MNDKNCLPPSISCVFAPPSAFEIVLAPLDAVPLTVSLAPIVHLPSVVASAHMLAQLTHVPSFLVSWQPSKKFDE